MISTNLSTRPFYNERLVHTVLLVLAVLVLAVTALNVSTILALSRKDGEQNTQAARAERKAADARKAATRIRQSINPAELQLVTTEATEANRLIDARTFSWTELLSEFEQTLPAEVRITGVVPHADRDGRLFVDITVVGRRADDINEFVDKLEARGAFTGMTVRQEMVNNEGLRETTLSGRYIGRAKRSN